MSAGVEGDGAGTPRPGPRAGVTVGACQAIRLVGDPHLRHPHPSSPFNIPAHARLRHPRRSTAGNCASSLRRRTTCWRTAARGRRKDGHMAAFPEGRRRTGHADELPPPAGAGHTTDGRRWRHPHPTRHGEVDETELGEATHGWTERTETGPSPARGRRRRTPSQQPLHGSRPPKRRNRKCGAAPSTRSTTVSRSSALVHQLQLGERSAWL